MTVKETETETKEYEVSDFHDKGEIRAHFHLRFDKRLRLCPFCGGRAFLNVTHLLNFIQVVCSQCYCQTEPKATVQESIERWNARPKRRKRESETEESRKSENSGSA